MDGDGYVSSSAEWDKRVSEIGCSMLQELFQSMIDAQDKRDLRNLELMKQRKVFTFYNKK